MISSLNFFFTQPWNQAQGSLQGVEGTLQSIAYSILAATFLLGVYESFLSGGSLQKFATTVLKFGVAAAIIQNWSAFFNDIVSTGSSVGSAMLGGAVDVIQQWATELSTNMSGNNLSSLSANGLSGLATSIVFLALVMISAMLFFGCMKIFMFMFILWGGVLYCMGPLMIALAPSGLVGSYAGQYCRSLAEWALWPAMYSMFAMLMTAISSPDVNAIMSGSSTTSLPGSLDQPTVEMLLLALTSLVYGVCMLFVPFIAHFLIKGDFAGVAMGMMRAGKAASAAISGGMGAGASGFMMKETSSGAASTAGGGGHGILPPPRPGGGGGGAISSPASTGANVMNMPPPPTPSSTNMVPPATARA